MQRSFDIAKEACIPDRLVPTSGAPRSSRASRAAAGVGEELGWLGRGGFAGGAAGDRAAEDCGELGEGADGGDGEAADQGGLGVVRRRDDQAAAGAGEAGGAGEDAGDGADGAVQRELAEEDLVAGWDVAQLAQDGDGERQVVARTRLREVGGRQGHQHACLRERDADRGQCGLDPVGGVLRGSRRADHGEGGETARDAGLDRHLDGVEADDLHARGAADAGGDVGDLVAGAVLDRGLGEAAGPAHRDGVEAHLLMPGAVLRQPRRGQSPQPALLLGRDRLQRCPRRIAAPRLDLAEDHHLAVARDDVDLPPHVALRMAPVARDDREPPRLQVRSSRVLAGAGQLACGHDGRR